MIVFAISDKGGTGRSVTSTNLAYRQALAGLDVCYLDFDFGSPTVGAIFDLDTALRGVTTGGLHSYLAGERTNPTQLDVWARTDRASLQDRPVGAGRMVLYPGDLGGGEFPAGPDKIRRCAQLLMQLESEFDMLLVDLSAGRSYAAEMVLAATSQPVFAGVTLRWLVYHKWTRQHIIAASGLVQEERGLIETGIKQGHSRDTMIDAIRFVRTAVVDPESDDLAGLSAEQIAWLRSCNESLQELAREKGVGRTSMLAEIPYDPVLQWREQIITDNDVSIRKIANRRTIEAFTRLAHRVAADDAWRTL